MKHAKCNGGSGGGGAGLTGLVTEDLGTYPLTPVPYSSGTADGFLTKNDKSKGFDYLTKGVDSAELSPYDTTLVIEDGNSLFYCMCKVPNKSKEISQY
jgi:hypothetical protein